MLDDDDDNLSPGRNILYRTGNLEEGEQSKISRINNDWRFKEKRYQNQLRSRIGPQRMFSNPKRSSTMNYDPFGCRASNRFSTNASTCVAS